jgi:hypothetical protein
MPNLVWRHDFVSEIINPELQEPETIKSTLLSILHEAYALNPSFIKAEEGYIITPNWAFQKWGLGTSSTLINNIAQWLQIDAFTLLNNSFGGSGYDIACAQKTTTHSLPSWKGKAMVEKATSNQTSQHIYFVYLNKKQSSKTAIANYHTNKTNNLNTSIDAINKNNTWSSTR